MLKKHETPYHEKLFFFSFLSAYSLENNFQKVKDFVVQSINETPNTKRSKNEWKTK